MFTFEDQGGRSVTLRPEGTAPIARAYLEHGMQKLPQPVKLWYLGPFFRHERPQAGRFRQFNQLGAEAIGSDSPLVDAELIMLLDELLRSLEVPALRLRLGSLGSPEARAAYREELIAYLREHEDELAKDVRERIDENPLRAFDSKDEGTQAVMAEAPTMLDRLDGEDAEHFAAVRQAARPGRDRLRARRHPGPRASTTTRAPCSRSSASGSGAQSEVGGGGRYDRLIEELDGPPTPAAGWAAGVERILLALGERATRRSRTTSSSPPRTASASGRWRSSPSCGTRACAPSSTSPAAA